MELLAENAYNLALLVTMMTLFAAQLGVTFVPLVFKSRRSGWLNASTVLAFITPVVILLLTLTGIHQGRVAMLESFTNEYPWDFAAQFYKAYDGVSAQKVFGGSSLAILGLLGSLCAAIWLLRFRREGRYQARLVTSIGLGIASFVMGLGMYLREAPMVGALSACGYWDANERIGFLAQCLKGTSSLWVPIVFAGVIVALAVLVALWRERKTAVPTRLPNSAVVAGVFMLVIGGGAFASVFGRAHDVVGTLPRLYTYLADISSEPFYLPRGVEVPRLQKVEKIYRSPSIIVGNDRVEIEGNMVGAYDAVAEMEGVNPRLLEHLANLKKNFLQLHPYHDFPGRVIIIGDVNSPSGVVEKVLMTCYLGGYRNIQIASVSINVVPSVVFGEIRIPRFVGVPIVLTHDEPGSLRMQGDETFGEFAKRVDKAADGGAVKVVLPGQR
jgi:hypothetical protein